MAPALGEVRWLRGDRNHTGSGVDLSGDTCALNGVLNGLFSLSVSFLTRMGVITALSWGWRGGT